MKAYRDEVTGRWHSDLPDMFDTLCKRLSQGEHFRFARYGDGEFNCIYGKPGANCDGHQYFPDLGNRLREALLRTNGYCVGLQPLTLASDLWPRIQKDFPDVNWVDADCIHNASIDGRLHKLFKSLRAVRKFGTGTHRQVMIVGPPYIATAANVLSIENYQLPTKNCWLEFDKVVAWINKTANRNAYPVVLLCASMMSEVIIDEFRYSEITFIDMGSVLDPYVGVKSRRYHHKLNINAGLSPS